MSLPEFSMRELIEAGVHFGHKTKRWNPAMAPYIYGVRNNTHIIDLGQTVPMLHHALNAVREVASRGGRILFVGTKRQASSIIAEAAKDCEQYYINQRWLGGLLTNWNTIQASIRRLKKLEEDLENQHSLGLTKKELLNLERQRQKLEKSLGGIKDMGKQPDMLFIIDINRENLAIQEALKLGLPTVAIVDTNASAENITYPIPGNDDATRAIQLYCNLISETISKARQHLPKASEIALKREQEAAAKAAEKEAKEKAAEEARKTASTTRKEATRAAAQKAKTSPEEPKESDKDSDVTAQEKKKSPEKKEAAKAASTKKPAAKTEEKSKAATKKTDTKKKPAAKKTAGSKTKKASESKDPKSDGSGEKKVKKAS